jgi:Cu/Ag efflux protein CusF
MFGSLRPVLIALVPIALAACSYPQPADAMPATTPIGVDLGGSGPVRPQVAESPPPRRAGEMQMAHDGRNDAHGTGTVNSVDPAAHKINLSHQPIPQIGWPAMTMDFAVAPSVNLSTLKPGTGVNFTIEKGAGGMYEIKALTPAGGAR